MAGSFTRIYGLLDRPFEIYLTLTLSIMTGLVIGVAADLRLAFKVALAAAFLAASLFLILPNKKQILIIAWLVIYPLSIEKVFPVGTPVASGFATPFIIISGSDLILAALALVLLFETCVLKPHRISSIPKAMTPFLLFTLWNVIVFLTRTPTSESLLSVILIIKMCFFMLIMVSAISTAKDFNIVLLAMAAAVAIQVLVVCYSSITGEVVGLSSKVAGPAMTFSGAEDGQSHVRATGTVGHVNQEASFLTFWGLALVGLPFLYSGISSRLAWLVLGGASLAVFLTFSRTAWVAIPIALFCVAALACFHRLVTIRAWLYLFPLILIGILAFPVFSPPVIDRLFHGDDGATSSRMRAVKLALDLTQHHPLMGVGPGHFARASLDYYPPNKVITTMRSSFSHNSDLGHRFGRLEVNQVRVGSEVITIPLPVHNKFLLVLSELGLIGLLLFLWFQWRIFLLIRQSIRLSSPPTVWVGIGLLAAFAATLVYMAFDLFSDDKSMQILLTVPVLAMSLHRALEGTSDE